MSKLLVLICVAAVVPMFFILTWLISSYHQLAGLRANLVTAAQELQQMQRPHVQQNDPRYGDSLALASQTYTAALNRYNQACRSFPTNIVARLVGFSLAEPIQFDSSRED